MSFRECKITDDIDSHNQVEYLNKFMIYCKFSMNDYRGNKTEGEQMNNSI